MELLKTKICILLRSSLDNYPPILALLECLVQFDVTIICGNCSDSLLKRYHSYQFVITNKANNRILSPMINLYFFRKSCKSYLNEKKYDIIWCATADTAIWLKGILPAQGFVLNIFELYDRHPIYKYMLSKIATSAKTIVVPEYNRANIFRVWFKLDKTPYVIPNKFIDKEMERRLPLSEIPNCMIGKINEKIILYQGIASPERNLEALCQAIKEMPNYKLLLMCNESDYYRMLKSKYPFIVHQPFVVPPLHLNVTSYAHIGIVTYDYYSLNTIFCAPNKIWEYSCFGIPMLGNSIPGLEETIGKYRAGLCVDMSSKEEIVKALMEIERSYAYYESGSKKLYRSVSVKEKYLELLSKQIN